VHQLRHTFACRWLEAGGSLPTLQQILGHRSVVTTQHYARLSEESVRLEAARINGTIASWRPPAA
jgi:integrase/recombinase XerD